MHEFSNALFIIMCGMAVWAVEKGTFASQKWLFRFRKSHFAV